MTALLVEVERSGLIESTHLVDVAVVGADGTLEARAGDSEAVAYLRSSAKPVQASACVELGWRPRDDSHLAIACASHNGEAPHIEAVRGILSDAGADEGMLRCPPAGSEASRISHNCSGKHAAMIATMTELGLDPNDYLNRANAIHQRIQARLEEMAGRAVRGVGVDGCGVPTFAFSLVEMARAYARLPETFGLALRAMRAHPYLVAGAQRICTAVMIRIPEVVIKVGAEGLVCGVHPAEKRAFAMKSRDGSARGREIAALRLFEMLGWVPRARAGGILEEIAPRLGTERAVTMRCIGSIERA